MASKIHLRRIITSGKFIPQIDGLRFLAIASVILFHLLHQLDRYYPAFSAQIPQLIRYPINNGDRGVRLFFVLSGFVLALPFAHHYLMGAKPVLLKRYFLRRLTRLEPPYLLSLLIMFGLIVITKHISPKFLLPNLAASSIYLHNILFGPHAPGVISMIAWSLEVEVQFYILVPLLTGVFLFRSAALRRGIIASAIVLSGCIQIALHPAEDTFVTLSIIYYIQFFLTGFLFADLYVTGKQNTRSPLWDSVGVVACLALFLVPSASLQITGPALILLAAWGALNGSVMSALFSNKAIVTIGGMCYSLYLLHFPLIAMATKLAIGRPIAMIFISLFLIAVVGPAYFVLIERPCMDPKWPAKFWAQLRGANRAEAPPAEKVRRAAA